MEGRRTYAHWLDPEYFAYRWLNSHLACRRFELLGLLKMRAILGDTLCISDVQLIDSRLIFELFSDAQFRAFVDRDLDFLRLVSRPTDRFSAHSEKLGVIESGLARVSEEWNSSTFSSPELHLVLAKHLRSKRPKDESHFKSLFGYNGANIDQIIPEFRNEEQKQLVHGMFSALYYFCSHPQCVEPFTNENWLSYFDILKVAESKSDNGEWRAELQDLIKFIENNTNKENRGKRTPPINKLTTDGLDNPQNLTRYMNILQAWNVGVARSVNPIRQSGYYFPTAIPFPFLFGDVSEVSMRVNGSDQELFKDVERRKWHPQQLEWQTVAQIRGECTAEILDYQTDPSRPETWKKLLDAITKIVIRRREGAHLLGAASEASRTWSPWMMGGTETGRAMHLLGEDGLVARAADKLEDISTITDFAELLAWCCNAIPTAVTIGAISFVAGLHRRFLPAITRRATSSAIDQYVLRYNLDVRPGVQG
jgi:hypothetical protein